MKTIVLTGASSGIGHAVLQDLIHKDVFLIAIVRNQEKASILRTQIESMDPKALTQIVAADLSSLQEICDASRQIASLLDAELTMSYDMKLPQIGMQAQNVPYESIPVIDSLIHCAGTVSSWYVNTEDAFELQFAVNHLAVHALTMYLMPFMQRSEDARVIVVSSNSHFGTRINWNDLMLRKRYSCLRAYKQSKLCNVLFVKELDRLYSDTIQSYAIDPGLVNTEIGLKGTAGKEAWIWRRRMKKGMSPEIPAKEIVSVVFFEHYRSLSGQYLKDGKSKRPSRYARNEKHAEKLWQISSRLCGCDQ